MRLHKLAGALTNSTHQMQVVFLVDAGLARSVVQQVMQKHPSVECRNVDQDKFGSPKIPNEFGKAFAGMQALNGSIMFRAKKRVA